MVGIHLAPFALGHDDAKRLHDVLERFEAIATVADDVDTANDAPGDQLAEARRDVRPAHVEELADLFRVERRGGDEEQGVHLGHRPIDAPGLPHLSPMKDELLCGRGECHGMFRPVWSNSFY